MVLVRQFYSSHVIIPVLLHAQVSAVEKNSGKSQTITITSEKGRLSEDEIERMVRTHAHKLPSGCPCSCLH